jgi:hypothetical protein
MNRLARGPQLQAKLACCTAAGRCRCRALCSWCCQYAGSIFSALPSAATRSGNLYQPAAWLSSFCRALYQPAAWLSGCVAGLCAASVISMVACSLLCLSVLFSSQSYMQSSLAVGKGHGHPQLLSVYIAAPYMAATGVLVCASVSSVVLCALAQCDCVVVLGVGLDRCCCRHFAVCRSRHPDVVSKLRYVAVCLSSPVVWGAQIPMESMCQCVSSSAVLSDAVVSTCTAYSSACPAPCEDRLLRCVR